MLFNNTLRTYSVTLSLLLGALACLNWCVDPFDQNSILAMKRFELFRNVGSSRTEKANRLNSGEWDILILGSSREETGYDPTGEPLTDLGKAYNAGLPGSNLFESRRVFDYFLDANKAETVVLGISLVMFGEQRTAVADFEESPFASNLANDTESGFDNAIRNLVGLQTTMQSIETMGRSLSTSQAQTEMLERQRSGHRPPQGFVDHPRRLSAELLRYYLSSPDAYANFRYSVERLNDVRYIVQRCCDEGLDLKIVISPVHSLQEIAIEKAGRWSDFEKMKRDVVDIVDQADGGKRIQFYDFSGFKGVVAEAMPSLDESEARMDGFFETSHFRPAIGQRVLEIVFNGVQDVDVPRLFYQRLDSHNIETHLSELRESRDEYMRAHPAELRWLEGL